MNHQQLIILYLLFLLLLTPMLIIHYRKMKCIRKTRSLSLPEKEQLLNQIVAPFGYLYHPEQDIFTSRLDAPQKLFGYHTFYDFAATFFHMVFDYETIYFNYQGKTWLIELWKGQYGINGGCECGIYYTDGIIPPSEYSSTHFEAVSYELMPDVSMKLYQSDNPPKHLGAVRNQHWWLTVFKPGAIVTPEKLSVYYSIRFPNYSMLHTFLAALTSTLPHIPYQVNGLRIFFTYHKSHRKHRITRRILRKLSLLSCHFFCKCFSYITRYFDNSGDKILYLYFYLPFTVRKLFTISKQ